MAEAGPVLPRRIAHFDLDSFFVEVERIKDPSLRGKPVLVGHHGRRGVVATASYEARAFGCRSAQPMVQALRLCPQAVVVSPDFAAYLDISRRFHAMLGELTPIVESGGIDEAYADLTGIGPGGLGGRAAAEALRTRVREELGVAVSACIAGSRTTAKVGSDRAKPDGLIEVPVGGRRGIPGAGARARPSIRGAEVCSGAGACWHPYGRRGSRAGSALARGAVRRERRDARRPRTGHRPRSCACRRARAEADLARGDVQ
ncbi:MAG: hypothetical protein FJ037_10520 [Chloroflexi bacterium]|nr:hypothetical protein [Chloroflexota bacterium]